MHTCFDWNVFLRGEEVGYGVVCVISGHAAVVDQYLSLFSSWFSYFFWSEFLFCYIWLISADFDKEPRFMLDWKDRFSELLLLLLVKFHFILLWVFSSLSVIAGHIYCLLEFLDSWASSPLLIQVSIGIFYQIIAVYRILKFLILTISLYFEKSLLL